MYLLNKRSAKLLIKRKSAYHIYNIEDTITEKYLMMFSNSIHFNRQNNIDEKRSKVKLQCIKVHNKVR